jgi:Ca2+-binding EF-hand superfamily protein
MTDLELTCRGLPAASDNSGTIDRSELDQALQSFGYPLPRDLVRKLEKRFGKCSSQIIQNRLDLR